MSNKAKAKHRTRVMLPLCRHTKPRLHTQTQSPSHTMWTAMTWMASETWHSFCANTKSVIHDRAHTKPRSIYSPLSQTHRHTQNTLRNTVRAPKKWKQCKDKDKKLLNKWYSHKWDLLLMSMRSLNPKRERVSSPHHRPPYVHQHSPDTAPPILF